MKKYIELNRSFAEVSEGDEKQFIDERSWGNYFGTHLSWKDLLEHRRIVLLAEAASGKTEEFKQRVKELNNQGKPAFFVRIEELAEQKLSDTLGATDFKKFQDWQKGYETGYFFLDSVDEARLNRKNFDSALKKFNREIYDNLNRISVFISCRVSDWKIESDRRDILDYIPIPKKEIEEKLKKPLTKEEAFLATIFSKKEDDSTNQDKDENSKKEELLVVRLLELEKKQWHHFAEKSDVIDPQKFIDQISFNVLELLAECPGDLENLVSYWKNNGYFSSRKDMIDAGIQQKIKEQDTQKAGNDVLSPVKAYRGSQAVAAALTFGKSFSLCAPEQKLEGETKTLDASKILPNWTDAEREALLRCGLFAPSTYGKVRFHHRSVQEYLTAQWLLNLLDNSCPKQVIFDLLFPDTYGVKTVVPSLQAVIAWMSVDNRDICNEVVERDPIILLDHGDPKSLPIEIKKTLLLNYANQSIEGLYRDSYIANNGLMLFADAALSKTIRTIWRKGKDKRLTMDLLTIIAAAEIMDCLDLVQELALGNDDIYLRRFATDALKVLEDDDSIKEVSKSILHNRKEVTGQAATQFAEILFPAYITVPQLLILLDRSTEEKELRDYYNDKIIKKIWHNCPKHQENNLIRGLVRLCTKQPYDDEYSKISSKHKGIAKCLKIIAYDRIKNHKDEKPDDFILDLLTLVERSRNYVYGKESTIILSLEEQLHQNKNIHHALFWHDIAWVRDNEERKLNPFWWWHGRIIGGAPLWDITKIDVELFYKDLEGKSNIDEKRIALSAILTIIKTPISQVNIDRITPFIETEELLQKDWEHFLLPPEEKEEDWEKKRKLKQEKYAKNQKEEEERNKKSWIHFRAEVVQDTTNWGISGNKKLFWKLHNLTRWLQMETDESANKAALQWSLLSNVCDDHTAQNYREGMKTLWRQTTPKRPIKSGSHTSYKYINVYSVAGIVLESREEGWLSQLTDAEVLLATKHGCKREEGYPDWLDQLLTAYPEIVLPEIKKELKHDWKHKYAFQSHFLSYFSDETTIIRPEIAKILFQQILYSKPTLPRQLEQGVKILSKLPLNQKQEKCVERRAAKYLKDCINEGNIAFITHYLTMLFLVNIKKATSQLELIFTNHPKQQQRQYVEQIISNLYGRDNPLAFNHLSHTTIAELKTLILLTYRFIKRSDDNPIPSGVHTPDHRDDAQTARGNILNLLFNKQSELAYQTVLAFKEGNPLDAYSHALDNRAHKMAVRDSEIAAWTEEETSAFGLKYTRPIKTGHDLYSLIISILNQIVSDFKNNDVSSKSVLQTAKDETAVQGWLAEQLKLRSKELYHTHREIEVADNKKPDINISSTSTIFEVAIEIKRDDWSVTELEKALSHQLAELYLKPQNRRHGILFIAHQQKHYWKHPRTNAKMSFEDVVSHLQKIAKCIRENQSGEISVCVIGIETN